MIENVESVLRRLRRELKRKRGEAEEIGGGDGMMETMTMLMKIATFTLFRLIRLPLLTPPPPPSSTITSKVNNINALYVEEKTAANVLRKGRPRIDYVLSSNPPPKREYGQEE